MENKEMQENKFIALYAFSCGDNSGLDCITGEAP